MSATIIEPSSATVNDRWVALPAAWRTYLRLLSDRGDRPRPRYIFLDGRLTVVSPGHHHESLRTRLAALIDEILVGLDIDFHASGSVTLLTSRRPRAGAEADAAYYLSRIDEVRGKADLVTGEDPPPDLAVEVVVSHPEGDALEAYARFGVREVWVCRRGTLAFLAIGADGRYRPAATSELLPFLSSEELAPWLFRDDLPSDARLRREFRAWVARELAPRLPRGGDPR